MATNGDVLFFVSTVDSFGLVAVGTDPASAIVGTWVSSATGAAAVTFLADGTYIIAENDGVPDATGGPGMELGSYTWNPSTGALSTSVAVETNGEWGLSHPPSADAQVSGDTLTFDGVDVFVRATGASAIVGGWYGADEGGEWALTFLADGTFLLASHESLGVDTGIEHGTYSWNPVSGAFSVSITADTNNASGGFSGESIIAAHVLSNVVEGDELDNVLGGGDEDDAVFGEDGNDNLSGLGGDDFLDGGSGTDTLEGGIGADTLAGGEGADSMAGGSGNDLYLVDDAGDLVVEISNTPPGAEGIQGIAGITDGVIAAVNYSLASIANVENLALGADAASGTGNALDNELVGNAHSNLLIGMEGGDSVLGAAGNDTLQGNQGSDTLRGALGEDELRGGQDGDFVYSGQGNDMVLGAFGADELRGGMGNDTISAGQGNDTVFGGAGEDFLQTRLGNDVATGGAGADTFWFNIAGAADADTILDFVSGEDLIQLDPGFFTDPALVVYDGASGQLAYNGQLIVTLAGAPASSASDLLFAA
jgi:Ca2+-binding RTX toxin-like protein